MSEDAQGQQLGEAVVGAGLLSCPFDVFLSSESLLPRLSCGG